MAIFEKTIRNKNFDKLLRKLEQEIPDGSWSADLEAGSDFKEGNARCSVRVFERYSMMGGNRLSLTLTMFQNAFLVATHTDREHIHNHIIYNSTALDCSRKFRDFLLSGLAVQRLSDLICLEHSLSVIEIKPYRERQKRVLYPPKESNRDQLCGVIDSILADKPGSYEEFLKKLEQQGYEVKRGKFTSVKGARQKRFIRFRTLGAGYSEEELKAVLAGEAEHCPRKKHPVQEQKFQMLVDIQAKIG